MLKNNQISKFPNILISTLLFILLVFPKAEAKDYSSFIEQAFIENNWEKVIEAGKEWKESEPGNPFPYYFMSHAYFASYYPDEGDDNLNKCSDRAKAEKFLPLAEKLVKKHPDNSHAHALLGSAYYFAEEYDKAIKALKKSIKMNPYYGGAYYILGNIYREKEEETKAASIYKNGIKKDPDFLLNYEKLRFCYASEGQRENEVKILKKGLENNGKENRTVRFHISLGAFYTKDKEYDKAIDILKTGLELRPLDILLNRGLGDAYTKSGRIKEAIEHYQRLLKTGGICCKSMLREKLNRVIAMQREAVILK